MSTRRTLLLPLVASAALLAAAGPLFAETPAGEGRVIVKLRAESPLLEKAANAVTPPAATRAAALAKRVALALRTGREIAQRTQVMLAPGVTSEALARRLAAEPDVEYAVPDQRRHRAVAPDDPLYATGPPVTTGVGGPAAGQWYLRAPAGVVASSINVEPAWDVAAAQPGIVVAVIDTGVRFDHPDLLRAADGGVLLPGYDMIATLTTANDGGPRDADASDPGDWVTQADLQMTGTSLYQCEPAPENSSWHGTQVSGIIGALAGNGIGMAGVARNVRILPVRVLGKCGGFDSDIIAGMRWAAGIGVPGVPANTTPARVLNLSLSGEGSCSSAYVDALGQIAAAGAVVVAAAGNSTGHAAGSPANCSGVVAVTALRHIGTKVGFSDLGSTISVSAPGGNCVNVGALDPCLYPILTTSNRGPTAPVADAAGGSIYTDSFNASLGTSFSAPLVSGTVALMLAVQPSLTPARARSLLQATARPFPTTGSFNNDGTPVPQCQAPQPIGTAQVDQAECFCTTATCGAGMLDAGAAVAAAARATPPNYSGLFWASPPGSESGWGLNVAHQGDVIFATWFTYDVNGKAWWLSMTGTKVADGTYSGTLNQTHGPAFSAVPFDPRSITIGAVGSALLTFTDVDNATFFYSVNGIAQTKAITRQVFGPVPACVWGALPDLAQATNHEDLWWAAPAGVESGWGINLTQEGSVIFATWFTYAADGTPLWLSATAPSVGPGTFAGPINSTTGPPFSSVPFDPARVTNTTVGGLTLTFASGNAGTFAYTVTLDGKTVTQTKAITRQIFRAPGTACQ